MELSQAELKLLTSVVYIHPTSEQLSAINDLIPHIKNWDLVLHLLLKQGSAPLFYVKLPFLSNKLIPKHEQFLKDAYFKTLMRGMVLYNTFSEVIDALGDMPILVLKGAYLSEHLYKDIALRQFSDIDLLVHEMNGAQALEALRKIGFSARASKPVSRFVENHSDIVHYIPMERNDVSVEIHIKLHGRSKAYNLSIKDIWSRSHQTLVFNKKVSAMCTEDLLIHLCIHADKHFHTGEIQLKSYNDIVNLLNSLPSNFDWTNFSALCQKYSCTNTVFTHLILVHKYYDAPLPEAVSTKLASVLQPDTENRFKAYLQGKIFVSHEEKSAVPGHINSLRNIKNPTLFFRYLYDIVFPSKKFMFEKYQIKSLAKIWRLYYFYRWWKGLQGLMEMGRKKK